MTLLLFVAAVSVMTTGCSDDDECCTGAGASDASGLGGQTYTSETFVGQAGATLVLVTRGGGTTSAASTGGMITADLAAGPVDGVLVFNSGLREILNGTYDPSVVDAPTLTARSSGNVSFEGFASSTNFNGSLVVDGVDSSVVSGTGRQDDAPLIHLLGTWEHNTNIALDCGTIGQFEFTCEGFIHMRKIGLNLRMDIYESCADEVFECKLSGPALTDGAWSGLNYAEATSYTRTINNCRGDADGDLRVYVDSQSLDSNTTAEMTFTSSSSTCPPPNTVCAIQETMTATRCVDCWPAECFEG